MEPLKDITESQKKYAIDLLATMTVEELAKELKKDSTEMLKMFLASNTGKLLFDESSKLWWNGPSYIADMYKTESRSS